MTSSVSLRRKLFERNRAPMIGRLPIPGVRSTELLSVLRISPAMMML